MKLIKAILLLSLLFTQACASMCRGVIGADYANANNIVDYTLKGSPAEKAGILPGDELLEPETIWGVPGRKLHVRVIRNDQVFHFDLVLACIDDLYEKPTWDNACRDLDKHSK